jgi:hypothetical protein
MTSTTDQLDEVVPLGVLAEHERGDFSVRTPLGWTGGAAQEGKSSRATGHVSTPVEGGTEFLLALSEIQAVTPEVLD